MESEEEAGRLVSGYECLITALLVLLQGSLCVSREKGKHRTECAGGRSKGQLVQN